VNESIGRLLSVVFESADPDRSARFWEAILGFKRHSTHPGWTTIADPDDGRRRLSFQQVPDHVPPTWPERDRPQQAHIDVLVDDLDVAAARVVDLGAQPLTDDVVDHDDESFRVYADPDGHPFCLIKQVAPDL
jgi:catechol 2,3-dioxygenase-like lactoylglutathione lyase family enzyme